EQRRRVLRDALLAALLRLHRLLILVAQPVDLTDLVATEVDLLLPLLERVADERDAAGDDEDGGDGGGDEHEPFLALGQARERLPGASDERHGVIGGHHSTSFTSSGDGGGGTVGKMPFG